MKKILQTQDAPDREPATRAHIAGSDCSVADITARAAVDFMKAARIQGPPMLKNLERWHAEVSARPSAKA
jgi:glutathione S-transferase